jgi:protein-S-isoprenylcysteine O-methyltransferase Ste14
MDHELNMNEIIIKRIFQLSLFWGLLTTIFFVNAGTIKWLAGWLNIFFVVISQSFSGIIVYKKNPELIKRRSIIGKNTIPLDRLILSIFQASQFLIWIIAAQDYRINRTLPSSILWTLGATIFLVYIVIITYSMLENTYFESTVRIQSDYQHSLINSGPYGLIRHPGYFGVILGYSIGLPLMLGSKWAVIPAVSCTLLLTIRTYIEDKFLQRELKGYLSYCKRVKHRLIPGVW